MQVIVDSQELSPQQRVFSFGDGCFTTIAVTNGFPEFLDSHITRLVNDSQRLNIPIASMQEAVSAIDHLAASIKNGVIKVIISRGSGGRGYSTSHVIGPDCFLQSFPKPHKYSDTVSLGIANGYLSEQPMLAGAKHCNRIENVLFREQADKNQLDDVICLDKHQHVIETSSANIFWFRDAAWHTPMLSRCGVKGVMRTQLLICLRDCGYTVVEGDYSLQHLISANTVVITNSVYQLRKVQHIIPHDAELNLDTVDKIGFKNAKWDSLLRDWSMHLQKQQNDW